MVLIFFFDFDAKYPDNKTFQTPKGVFGACHHVFNFTTNELLLEYMIQCVKDTRIDFLDPSSKRLRRHESGPMQKSFMRPNLCIYTDGATQRHQL